MRCVSIDQNCTPLWDALPKLAALRARGFPCVHFVEDVDVAFTQQRADPATPPHPAPERVYPGGNSDWGATAFYSNFLGRNPINPRTLEPFLHASINTFAKRAGFASLDELYAAHASSDNIQIIAPSHSGDNRHRTLGDLSLREMRAPLRELLEHARADTRRAFPLPECAARADAFFNAEHAFLNTFHNDHPAVPLADFYAAWTQRHVPGQTVKRSSSLFENDPHELLHAFVNHYETLAPLYNRAIAETNPGIAPLNPGKGDLPFFALWRRDGKNYRTPASWQGSALATDGFVFPVSNGLLPLDEMRQHGLVALPPKALLLVMHARQHHALALPWQGSLYMPAARRLEELLQKKLAPVLRVRFHFFERLKTLDTPVRLPEWLAPFFSSDLLPASQFAIQLRDAQRDARATLDALRNNAAHLATLTPDLSAKINTLQRERASQSPQNPLRPLSPLRPLTPPTPWQQQKSLQQQQARAQLHHIISLAHLLALDYWDSRGALLPHALALGGEPFYQSLLHNAEIFTE